MAPTMEEIFRNHPCWAKMKELLLYRSRWPLSPLSNENRLLNIEDALNFGNHKGTNQQPELLTKLIQDDVNRGFALSLPLNKLKKIPDVLFRPLNIQLQKTINKCGKIIPNKDRMTHDLSWCWQSGTSVNNRVDEEKLTPCFYGCALKYNKLGSRSKMEISWKDNLCFKIGCESSILALPSKRRNGSANLHTTPSIGGSPNDAMAPFWRHTLPIGVWRCIRVNM